MSIRKSPSPPLAGGDKGEGETIKGQNTYYFITPTLILPRQGGGDYCVSGWTLAEPYLYYTTGDEGIERQLLFIEKGL